MCPAHQQRCGPGLSVEVGFDLAFQPGKGRRGCQRQRLAARRARAPPPPPPPACRSPSPSCLPPPPPASRLVERVEEAGKGGEQPFDVHALLGRMTMEVIGRTAFG